MNTTTRTPHIGDVFYHGWGFNGGAEDSLASWRERRRGMNRRATYGSIIIGRTCLKAR